MIKDNGAAHSGDLTRATTHLIARDPKGKKYDMAPKWGVKVVAEEWLRDSVERGMVLDESLYHLNINPEERGIGAWKKPVLSLDPVLGKRTSEEAELPAAPGKRKIRRALSKKLSSQHDAIWSDIAAIPAGRESQQEWPTDDQDKPKPNVSNLDADHSGKPNPQPIEDQRTADPETRERIDYPVLKSHGSEAIFSGIRVYVYGFSAHKVSTSFTQWKDPTYPIISYQLHGSI
jgi:DNA replication regulator DPB11